MAGQDKEPGHEAEEVQSECAEWGVGRLLRGRLTAAIYAQMDACVREYDRARQLQRHHPSERGRISSSSSLSAACVASSPSAYTRLALELSLASPATTSHLQMGIDQVRDRVGACAHVLFEDRSAVREWEKLLWRATEG